MIAGATMRNSTQLAASLVLDAAPTMSTFTMPRSLECSPPAGLRPTMPDESTTAVVSYIINVILIPIVCVPGVFAAFTCVIVFTKPKMRSSLNVYLAGLSIFDLVLLAQSILIYPPMSICVRTTALFTFPISLVAQTASVWTLVAISFDRYVAVVLPLRAHTMQSASRALGVLLGVVCASLLYKLPSVFELRLDACGRLESTELRSNRLYFGLYYTYGYLLFIVLLPSCIMLCLNAIVVRCVHRAYRKRQSLVECGYKSDDKERRCTLMAVVTVSTFILFNALAAIANVIEAFFPQAHHSWRLIIPLSNLLICVNSASNIVIYSAFGRRFRRQCAKLLCPCLTASDYFYLAQNGFNASENNAQQQQKSPIAALITRADSGSARSLSIALPAKRPSAMRRAPQPSRLYSLV